MIKRILGAVLISALVLSSVACGKEEAEESSVTTVETSTTDKAEEVTEVTYPLTISHAYGETVIDSQPERVVALNDTNADAILALGVVPLGVSKIGYGVTDEYGLPYWVTEAFEALDATPYVFDDTDGIDYEAINDLEPDIIIAPNSGLTQEEYEKLSEIAPTIPYIEGAYAITWEEQVEVTAKALGLVEEGQALIEETKATIEETLAKYPQLEGKTAAFMWINPSDLSTMYVYLPYDPRAGFVEELGLDLPDEIEKLAGEGEYAVEISLENVDVLADVDIIICYGEEGIIEELQANSIMNTLSAVKNGAIVTISSESNLYSGTYATVLSVPAVLDEYLGLLAKAADKIQ